MKNEKSLDMFSYKGQVGDTYAKFRPTYPEHMMAKLLQISNGKKTCLDIASGTGCICLKLYEQFPELAVANHNSQLQLQILRHNIIPSKATRVICCDASISRGICLVKSST
jgi:hypothetical protein